MEVYTHHSVLTYVPPPSSRWFFPEQESQDLEKPLLIPIHFFLIISHAKVADPGPCTLC